MPDISQADIDAGARSLREPWQDPPSEEDIARRVLEAAGPGIVAEERERIRPLVARWREAARSLESHNALWSSHFYDCARELDDLLGPEQP